MAPMWFSSFFENDSVLRTSRETRCLGQSGNSRACPLPQGAVEAFDVVRFAAALAYGFMAFARKDFTVSSPKVGVEHSALPVYSGQRSPKSLCSCLTSTADEHTYDLSG